MIYFLKYAFKYGFNTFACNCKSSTNLALCWNRYFTQISHQSQRKPCADMTSQVHSVIQVWKREYWTDEYINSRTRDDSGQSLEHCKHNLRSMCPTVATVISLQAHRM